MREQSDDRSLALFAALACDTRLKIIRLLGERPMNVGKLAAALGISAAAVTTHIHKLEAVGVVGSIALPGKHGSQKVCSLLIEELSIPLKPTSSRPQCYTVEMPVGHYVNWDIQPTCGLAGLNGFIGQMDDPRFFADPSRMDAGMLWLGSGFVEYRFPNYLLPSQRPVAIEFAAELSSEAPGINNDWPSDIYFWVNGVMVGMWTSPGDFGGRRGAYTPEWIIEWVNQYGLLKVLRVDEHGTTIDGIPISTVTLADLDLGSRADITLRLESPQNSTHAGGLTIFGRGFGNYGRDPEMRLLYELRVATVAPSPLAGEGRGEG
ncbi:MAG: ArsR family transcriptional regulator [Armatimonadota bacterium]|nr:ArsR family transcriptional regulator [bacterium]